MNKKIVSDLQVSGKKVIVRVDFNVPHKGDTITDDNRIVAALPTIKYLVDNKAKVILLSHLGKIDYKKTPEEIDAAKKKNDMSIVAKKLQEHLPNNKVTFVNATRGAEIEPAVNALKEGEIVLMQNTRYEKGESKNDEELGKYWAGLADLYVSDAFGSVHRAHASTVGIPTHLPSACGYLIEKELKFLGDAVEKPVRPFVGILGGAKVADKLKVISNLLEKCDTLIIGGGMAYTFLKAEGKEIGTSLVDNEQIDYCKTMIQKAKDLGKKLLLPVDVTVCDAFPDPIDGPVTTQVVDADKIPANKQGLDIGPKTAELFANEVKNAKGETVDTSLRSLGGVDTPSKINIYAKNFESKERIKAYFDTWNDSQTDESMKITYSDMMSMLFGALTTMVDAVTYVLVAFTSISLIVSSVMIGIITYVSVVERTKEIGILRALGASKRNISSPTSVSFLSEAETNSFKSSRRYPGYKDGRMFYAYTSDDEESCDCWCRRFGKDGHAGRSRRSLFASG